MNSVSIGKGMSANWGHYGYVLRQNTLFSHFPSPLFTQECQWTLATVRATWLNIGWGRAGGGGITWDELAFHPVGVAVLQSFVSQATLARV